MTASVPTMSLLIHPDDRIGVPAEDPAARPVLPARSVPDQLGPDEFGPDEFVPDELLLDAVVERVMLRLEFEAIIAAGYRPAGNEPGEEQPCPVPPARRVATVVGGRRPIPSPHTGVGNRRPRRPRRAATAAMAAARERGPPRAGP
jgi:hypothetical protein